MHSLRNLPSAAPPPYPFLKKIYFYFTSCVHVCIGVKYALKSVGALGAGRESLALDPLELELRVAVNHLVQVGNQTQVLGTSST